MDEQKLRLSALAFLAGTFSPTISREIVADQDFIKSLGVDRKPQLELVGNHFTREAVFEFIKDSMAGRPAQLVSIDGSVVAAAYENGRNNSADIIIQETACHFEAATILSEDSQVRQAAIKSLLLSRSFPEHRKRFWISRAERELLVSDYLDFLSEWESTPQNFYKELRDEIRQSGDICLEQWLPRTTFPIDAILGRVEDSKSLSEFFSGELLRQRASLMQAGMVAGLIQVGVGYVTTSAEFLESLSDCTDDELATAIESLNLSSLNLNSLLLVFDICALRFRDARFIKVGGEIISIIVEKPGTMYQDVAIAALALTPRIYAYQELKAQPEYYRRLVIWTWSNLVGQVLTGFGFDRGAVWKGMQDEVGVEAQVATVLARRSAPLWRPELISPEGVWGQSIRRMNDAIQRFCPKDVPQEWVSKVTAGLKEMEGKQVLVWGFAFGPLDEFKGADISLMDCPADVAARIYDLSDPSEFIRRCKFIGMTAKLPESLLNDIRDRLEKMLGDDCASLDHGDLAEALECVAGIAGAYRNKDIAKSVSIGLFKLFELNPKDHALAALYLAIDASNAFEDEQEYESFFIENTSRIAARRLPGDVTDACVQILNLVGRFSASMIPLVAPVKMRFRMNAREAFL